MLALIILQGEPFTDDSVVKIVVKIKSLAKAGDFYFNKKPAVREENGGWG